MNGVTSVADDSSEKVVNSGNIEVLMAKFSNIAYKNIRKLKNGQVLFKEVGLTDWKYQKVEEAHPSIKDKIFLAVNIKSKEAVIIFKGSEPLPSFDLESLVNDWCISDFNLVSGKIPEQFYNAYSYVKNIKKSLPEDFSLYMTGHSLGGSLVQLLCALKENQFVKAYTYNAFGSLHLIPCLKANEFVITSEFNHINNFSMSADIVSNQNKHIGNVFIVKYDKSFIQTLLHIVSETPKILTDIPYKIKRSIKYYLHVARWFFIRIDGHLMNNFINGFNYEKHNIVINSGEVL